MNMLKVIGFVAGLGVVALVGGGAWWLYRQKKQRAEGSDTPTPVPSKPPRSTPESPERDTKARGDFMGPDDIPAVLREALDTEFADSWPPDDEVIDNLTTEDIIVFAVESEPVGNYTETRQELLSGKVLSVEKTVVRARVQGPVAYAEHHGSHAGHGFRMGDLVEVPRSKILVAARSKIPQSETGYNSKGRPALTLKPSNVTKQTYKVRPGTPYDLVLPYRTPELEWSVKRELVKMVKIGDKGNLEQVFFTEDSMRGPVSVYVLDNDPKEGNVFVARWDFQIVEA